MKKRRLIVFVLAMVAMVCFSLCGCESEPLQGKSAYEIAVEKGFSGSEEDWLDSLVGRNGRDGQDADNAVDIYELYDAYCELYPQTTFAEFLQQFMVVDYYDAEYAASKAIMSSVSVYCTFNKLFTESYSAGSGVVFKIEDGYAYILTNYHVIYDRESSSQSKIANSIKVYAYGFEYADYEINAEFLGGSITKDIAVLRVNVGDFPSSIYAATLADSNELTLGEKVVAIGNPLAEGIAVTTGVVSVDSEDIEMEALDSASSTITMRVIRTDTAINSGNSGGGLFNSRGELLGIVNAKTVESGVESMGYAIPVNVAIGIANCVLENEAKKCMLGIYALTEISSTIYNTQKNKVEIIQTVSVDSVVSTLSQPLSKGDILQSVSINDGTPFTITRSFHLSDFLYNVRLGDTIHLNILRNSAPLTISLSPTSTDFTPV